MSSNIIKSSKLKLHVDKKYDSVVELKSLNPNVSLIKGYGDNMEVFSVDGSGNLIANSKSFLIKHPTKDDYALRHGCLEGPEHGVYVRGKLKGSNTIYLPDYWVELVDDETITVQLTSIGNHQNLYVKNIVNNTIVVSNGNLLSGKINCFYLVQAERKDIDKMVEEYPIGTQPLQ